MSHDMLRDGPRLPTKSPGVQIGTSRDDPWPRMYPGPYYCTESMRYVKRYQKLNERSFLTEWQFETYGQRAAREKEQAK